MSINSGTLSAKISSTSVLNGSLNVPDWIKGDQGPQGEDGKNTVWIGTTAPIDNYYNVWINPEGEETDGLITLEYLKVNYYDKAEVEALIEQMLGVIENGSY